MITTDSTLRQQAALRALQAVLNEASPGRLPLLRWSVTSGHKLLGKCLGHTDEQRHDAFDRWSQFLAADEEAIESAPGCGGTCSCANGTGRVRLWAYSHDRFGVEIQIFAEVSNRLSLPRR